MFVIKLKTLLLYAAVLIISLIVGVASFYCLKGQTPHIVESFKENESVELPIIMYHGLTENPSKVNTYVIPVSDFESYGRYREISERKRVHRRVYAASYRLC